MEIIGLKLILTTNFIIILVNFVNFVKYSNEN